jgi:hypothetical protein
LKGNLWLHLICALTSASLILRQGIDRRRRQLPSHPVSTRHRVSSSADVGDELPAYQIPFGRHFNGVTLAGAPRAAAVMAWRHRAGLLFFRAGD